MGTMIGERTLEGFEVRLRTRDPFRFVSATFLAVWLCGWAFGESFALWMLVKGAYALITGTPPDPGRAPLQLGPAVMTGAFLLVWLTIWTVGGIGALGEFLRLVWGVDRIVASSGRLVVTWIRGPFRSSRSFERESIRRMALSSPRGYLYLEAGPHHVELSRLGTRDERAEGAAELTAELALAPQPEGTVLPDRWEEIVTPEGERAVVPKLATRRTQAQIAGAIAMGAALVTFLIARDIPRQPQLAIPATIGFAITAALGWGTLRLARRCTEWRLGNGSLTLRERSGGAVRDRFETRRLLLDSSTDSDGDVWYELFAAGDPGTAPPKPVPVWRTSVRPPNSRSLARVMNDYAVVHDLATWLARETGLALEDKTTPQARGAELAKLRAALEQSGRFGRWAAKLVDRAAEHNERTG